MKSLSQLAWRDGISRSGRISRNSRSANSLGFDMNRQTVVVEDRES